MKKTIMNASLMFIFGVSIDAAKAVSRRLPEKVELVSNDELENVDYVESERIDNK